MKYDIMYLKKFNNRLNSIVGANINTALTIAQLLNISKEGAYRRLRGDTSFNLDELLVLRRSLGVSIDELTEGTENISFSFKPMYGNL